MIAVVTGANGFIGRHLCATLVQRGHETRPVVRADFTDNRFEQIVDGADVLIHAAGATRAPTRAKLRASNIDLTRRVLDVAKKAGVRRFVFVSSQAAAGPARSLAHPTREEDEPAPVEEYGVSSATPSGSFGTVVCRQRSSARRRCTVRATATSVRCSRSPHRGMAIHAGNRDQWISIIHVRDCVDGILRAELPVKAESEIATRHSTFEIRRATTFSRTTSPSSGAHYSMLHARLHRAACSISRSRCHSSASAH